MGVAFLYGNGGSGGASLNYKIVGGTSAPSNPKENTIWVNTSTAITSHVFSATQPTGSAGMVWIKTGTTSNVDFNAIKKNSINVYPIEAKQYVSGAWVDRTSEIYQGGAWKEFVRLPVLNSSYPENVTVSGGTTTSATFKVQIATAGVPASYTYQWYVNGTAVSGATSATYTRTGLTTKGTWTVYCKVTNAAGTVQSRTATLTVSHTILYLKGDKCTANTGGWVFEKARGDGYDMGKYTDGASSFTLTLDNLKTAIEARTKNKVSLNGYSTLKCIVSSNTYGQNFSMCVDDATVFSDTSSNAQTDIGAKSTGTFSLNISSFTNSLYVGIFSYLAYNASTSKAGSITITHVWLE